MRLVEGSWFEALPDRAGAARSTWSVSNPPYVAEADELPAEVADWEPAGALVSGPTGTEALEALVERAGDWLARPAALVVELAPAQAPASRRRRDGPASSEVARRRRPGRSAEGARGPADGLVRPSVSLTVCLTVRR